MQRELLSITNANVGNNYFCDLCLVITLRAAVERSRSVCTQQGLCGRQSGSAVTGTATERQRRKGAVVKSTVPGTLQPYGAPCWVYFLQVLLHHLDTGLATMHHRAHCRPGRAMLAKAAARRLMRIMSPELLTMLLCAASPEPHLEPARHCLTRPAPGSVRHAIAATASSHMPRNVRGKGQGPTNRHAPITPPKNKGYALRVRHALLRFGRAKNQ